LRNTSDLEINVSGKLKKELADELNECKVSGFCENDIFDQISKHICDTILVDSVPRFKKSPIFQEMNEILKE
jgi:hypothetical protein